MVDTNECQYILNIQTVKSALHEVVMGIWVELGIFVLALAFGLWQIQDVKKAQAERLRREAEERESQARLDAAKPPEGHAKPPQGKE